MWLYRAKIARVVRGLPSDPDARHFVLMIFVAFLPAAVAGALLSGYVKRVLYTTPSVIAASFIVGGIVMLVVERFRRPTGDRRRGPDVAVPRARDRLCQVLALVPGVSRSGATIVGGMLLGLDRPAAAEFSFFLAMPTMMAAFAHDLMEVRHHLARDARRRDRRWIRHGIHRVRAGRQALSGFRRASRLRAVRVVSDTGGRRVACGGCLRLFLEALSQ